MKIKFLSARQISLDGKLVGHIGQALAAAPQQEEDILAAHEAFLLGDAEVRIAEMRAKYEPEPLPDYFLIVELPEKVGEADHAGVSKVEMGGNWQGDLLKRTGEGTYVKVQAGTFTVPLDPAVKDFTELTVEQARADVLVAHKQLRERATTGALARILIEAAAPGGEVIQLTPVSAVIAAKPN
jgi:hypothetical protein